MRILYLSRWFPCPPSNGARIRVYNFLRSLAAEHDVTLLSFAEPTDDASVNGLKLRNWETVPWREFDPFSRRGILGLLSPMPRSLTDTYSFEMEKLIWSTLSAGSFDLIIASGITMASYSHLFNEIPSILEELEVGAHHQRCKMARGHLEKIRHQLTWIKLGSYLRRLLPQFQLCSVVSEEELRLLEQLAPDFRSIEVIPNGIDLKEYETEEGRLRPKSLIFCGSCDYWPNYQGIRWFLDEVYPLIKSREPAVNLTVTGKKKKLPITSDVFQTGYVKDVKPLITTACVSIVPILSGGGTRLKILESMALGTPVVSTSKGAEGLKVTDRLHLLIGDSPQVFAESVLELLRNKKLRQRISSHALNRVTEQYDWRKIMERFIALVEPKTSNGSLQLTGTELRGKKQDKRES